jgi:hypothetical protein
MPRRQSTPQYGNGTGVIHIFGFGVVKFAGVEVLANRLLIGLNGVTSVRHLTGASSSHKIWNTHLAASLVYLAVSCALAT